MGKIKEFFSRIFSKKKKRTWTGLGGYIDSKEFLEDIHEAVVKGAQNQGGLCGLWELRIGRYFLPTSPLLLCFFWYVFSYRSFFLTYKHIFCTNQTKNTLIGRIFDAVRKIH